MFAIRAITVMPKRSTEGCQEANISLHIGLGRCEQVLETIHSTNIMLQNRSATQFLSLVAMWWSKLKSTHEASAADVTEIACCCMLRLLIPTAARAVISQILPANKTHPVSPCFCLCYSLSFLMHYVIVFKPFLKPL